MPSFDHQHSNRLPSSRFHGPRTRLALSLAATALVCAAPGATLAGDTPAPGGARVYIVSPADGEVVSSPFKVVFGLSGMGVAPAGIKREKTGHHHLVIDAPVPDPKFAIPSDANHRHFGGGQTETLLDLPPGKHTLQLVMGDFIHVQHDPPIVSPVIAIEVLP